MTPMMQYHLLTFAGLLQLSQSSSIVSSIIINFKKYSQIFKKRFLINYLFIFLKSFFKIFSNFSIKCFNFLYLFLNFFKFFLFFQNFQSVLVIQLFIPIQFCYEFYFIIKLLYSTFVHIVLFCI